MTVRELPLDAATLRLRTRVLARNAWFEALDSAARQEILRHSAVRHYPARSVVYAAGSPPNGLFMVLRGEVRLEHLTRSGRFAFYQSTRPSEFFGLLSEIDGSPRFSDARVRDDATLLHVPHARCQELYRHHPAVREAFVALVCQQMHVTLNMLVEAHSIPPRRQVANILVTLLARGRSGDETAEHPRLTHEAIAAMAGVSRPTVAKILHDYRAQGLIDMQYGRIRLLDDAALATLADAADGG
jgi:CRP/FNR family cyclic AMP-dependent transcriptional regulator